MGDKRYGLVHRLVELCIPNTIDRKLQGIGIQYFFSNVRTLNCAFRAGNVGGVDLTHLIVSDCIFGQL